MSATALRGNIFGSFKGDEHGTYASLKIVTCVKDSGGAKGRLRLAKRSPAERMRLRDVWPTFIPARQ